MSKYIIRREKGTDFDGEQHILEGMTEIECDGFLLITFDEKDRPDIANTQGVSVDMIKDFLMTRHRIAMKIRAAAISAEADLRAMELMKDAQAETKWLRDLLEE